mgnify:CR=1 FL=1
MVPDMAIELKKVDFSYSENKKVLDGFSLVLPERGAVCLKGPSGCGKTTLLRLLAGLEKPQGGSITGIDNLRAAFVFQENRLLPWMSALDNIAVVCGASQRADAEKWLNRVGLNGDAGKRPGELSGGMKRRVAIARALAAPADFLILDEPFVGLDDALWTSIAREIRKAYANRPIIVVTHITRQAEELNAEIRNFSGPPLAGLD